MTTLSAQEIELVSGGSLWGDVKSAAVAVAHAADAFMENKIVDAIGDAIVDAAEDAA